MRVNDEHCFQKFAASLTVKELQTPAVEAELKKPTKLFTPGKEADNINVSWCQTKIQIS